jgi:hypothetical protein
MAVKLSALHAPALCSSGRFLVLICQRLSQPRGHSETGRIRYLKKSCDLIGNRLCDLMVRVPGYRSRGSNSRHYQIFWEVVGLERGPLRLVGTIQALLGRKSSGSGRENWEYGGRDPSRWQRGTLYPQKLALTSSWWWSLGRYSSLADSGYWVCFLWLHR